MDRLSTMTYSVTGRVARIVLDRPHRGNAITFDMPRELAQCVERANLDPAVHVVLLSGAGEGFCAGYDLTDFAASAGQMAAGAWPAGSPMDPRVV
ncbi:MAG TPA: enoyl-CoA hydratase/isomerase family protein, partial [Vicinamibacteria bacterium]|nr:enoyl-CoA hydratase/isomerase family protein [Vicinamibacteria bacterium]